MYDFLVIAQTVFAIVLGVLGALIFPFLPVLVLYWIYKKWVLASDKQLLSTLFVCFMIAFALLGFFYHVYNFSDNAEMLLDEFQKRFQ